MPQHPAHGSAHSVEVTLREVQPVDLPTLFAFEHDAAWCALAKVKPRTWEVFESVWMRIFQERDRHRVFDTKAGAAEIATSSGDNPVAAHPGSLAAPAPPVLVQRAILANRELCGTIGLHVHHGRPAVGYGLGQRYWRRGIATRALTLLLAEGGPMTQRPLFATAAASNTASIRILLKHGFVITERRTAPETERTPAREEVSLVLE